MSVIYKYFEVNRGQIIVNIFILSLVYLVMYLKHCLLSAKIENNQIAVKISQLESFKLSNCFKMQAKRSASF